MNRARCLIGNSSSGIREGAFIGTPVVNIGTRQSQRERGANVVDAISDTNDIVAKVSEQLAHGPYKMEDIYGDGRAGQRIAQIFSELDSIQVQKTITF